MFVGDDVKRSQEQGSSIKICLYMVSANSMMRSRFFDFTELDAFKSYFLDIPQSELRSLFENWFKHMKKYVHRDCYRKS